MFLEFFFFSVKWELCFFKNKQIGFKTPRSLHGNRLKPNYNITSHDVVNSSWEHGVHVIQKFINIAFIFPSFIRIQKPVTDNIAELLRKFKHRENKLSEIET